MWNQQVYYLPGAPATLQGWNSSLIHSTEKNSSKNQPTAKLIKAQRHIVKVPRVNASVFFYHSYRKQEKKWDDLGNKNKITFRKKLFQEFPILHQFLHVGFSPQTVQQCKNTNKAAYVALCLQQPAKKAEALLCSTLQSFGRGTNTQWHQRTEPTPVCACFH